MNAHQESIALVRMSADQVEAVLYAVEGFIVYRGNDQRRVPRDLLAARQILRITSDSGSETCNPETELSNELIDTNEAARILGCSTRWVRAIRADLAGRKFGDRWLFTRSHVTEYAAAKNEHFQLEDG